MFNGSIKLLQLAEIILLALMRKHKPSMLANFLCVVTKGVKLRRSTQHDNTGIQLRTIKLKLIRRQTLTHTCVCVEILLEIIAN